MRVRSFGAALAIAAFAALCSAQAALARHGECTDPKKLCSLPHCTDIAAHVRSQPGCTAVCERTAECVKIYNTGGNSFGVLRSSTCTKLKLVCRDPLRNKFKEPLLSPIPTPGPPPVLRVPSRRR